MTITASGKPILFVLAPNFEDVNYPGQRFFCKHCALIEGVLASFPALAGSLEVRRIGFARPRTDVVGLIGADNQSLPVLVLASGDQFDDAKVADNGRSFVSGADAIIQALVTRGYIVPPHP